ncbi:tripartite motif-containing protein 2-like isoform X1 [Pieris brassicae]|uniref:tripartite motif-containing protein 2-like isoform X1 n=1 Tax=Pieris brassicae TaxID=7116 RepID=UPI001E661D6D|nr:tripartite motif-containing protein 2-like isoform X1 [Pieris brassicae]
MSEKLKKKPGLFSTKRWNSQKNDHPISAPMQSSPILSPPVPSRSTSIDKTTKLPANGINDLVQCALCLELLNTPKMLPCQHTFCLACLKVYVADLAVVSCPLCHTRIQTGPNFVESLPSNLYIDTLLHMVGIKAEKTSSSTPPTTPAIASGYQNVDLFAAGMRCTSCKTVCDNSDTSFCEHCKLNFCFVCWSQHLEDLRIQVGSILKQLETAESRLTHKIEHYKDRCEHIAEQIDLAAEEKINAILEAKHVLQEELTGLQKSSDMSALALQSSLDEAKQVANKAFENTDDINKVETFVHLHQNTLQLLSDVSKWDAETFIFDKENFRIESDVSTPCDAESDDPLPEAGKQNNPLESDTSLMLHYKSRNFVPHYMWRKTARPCGVGLSPWNNNLYICDMDSHSVIVVERTQAKIVMRLSCEQMLCPVQIAFMKSLGEVYITDKWKHCIHVFSKDGEYITSIGQKGSRAGMFRSPEGIATDNANHHIYVVDTGNDRVQVLEPNGKCVDQYGVGVRSQPKNTSSIWEMKETMCTEFNAPTAVAVTNDRVIVLDSGNRRVKIYNKHDKSKIVEFGSMGQRKGQFRQPEVLAVDPMGYILVGDSGNCRVQIFKPNGQLVRVFGRLGSEPGKFSWISGIHVTKQLDVIVSDTKNHCVNFF